MAEFPKHYNHLEVEKRIQQFWDDERIYQFDKTSTAPIFSVDTPPPYVSADHLHVGHAMSYSQAEFVVRYHRMKGDNIFYPMGFDDNGLPTERFVEKKYKINKNKITRKEFIDLCLTETAKGAETYRSLWRQLGISVDWSLSYSTIDPHCQKTAQKSFLDLYEKGLIERRAEPIIWCYQCQTSLAQADVESETLNSQIHDVEFQDESGKPLIISTTRPELIPACVALYVNPDDERYRALVGKKATVPLLNYQVPIKTDATVEKEFGTGLMMVCTWGDMEDVRKWKEHKLDTRLIFDSKGQVNEKGGPFQGLYFNQARKAVLEKLKEAGKLLKSENISHAVGLHERCSTPIDFNLAPQWFIKVLPLKNDLLKRGTELNWFPEFMKIRYDQWVTDLKWDWNISRQRYYGVPFPLWYCGKCRHPIMAAADSLPVDPTIDKPSISKCPKCGSDALEPESDVMDTWMTSSLTPLINAHWANADKELMGKIYPMSVRPQAFEIIRTWLFYTVLKSHQHTDSLPWKNVMISGWGLDGKGRKISKSLGNFVEAGKLVEQYSADAVRFWSAGASLGHDLRYNERDVEAGRKIVVKLFNAIKFVASNLEKSSLESLKGLDYPASKPQVMIDRWVLSNLEKTLQTATQSFEEFEFCAALRAIERFFWMTYCDNYLEIIKDRFWSPEEYGGANDPRIQNAHSTLYLVSKNLLKLMAPFFPFITEELWQRFFKEREGVKSIHISSWPKSQPQFLDKAAEESGDLLLKCLVPIRKYKSEQKLHQNHQLTYLGLSVPGEKAADFGKIAEDLASAARYKSTPAILPAGEKPATFGATLTPEIDGISIFLTT